MSTELTFTVSVIERAKAQIFLDAHKHPEVQSGTDGRHLYSWEFEDCSIGTTIRVHCLKCKAFMDVTDWSNW